MNNMDNKRIKVIALCGSSKFKEEFHEVTEQLNVNGYHVIVPRVISDTESKEQKKKLLLLSKQTLDHADAILVINKGGYIGVKTNNEIQYAKNKGKQVFYRYLNCECFCMFYSDVPCLAHEILPSFDASFDNVYPQCPFFLE